MVNKGMVRIQIALCIFLITLAWNCKPHFIHSARRSEGTQPSVYFVGQGESYAQLYLASNDESEVFVLTFCQDKTNHFRTVHTKGGMHLIDYLPDGDYSLVAERCNVEKDCTKALQNTQLHFIGTENNFSASLDFGRSSESICSVDSLELLPNADLSKAADQDILTWLKGSSDLMNVPSSPYLFAALIQPRINQVQAQLYAEANRRGLVPLPFPVQVVGGNNQPPSGLQLTGDELEVILVPQAHWINGMSAAAKAIVIYDQIDQLQMLARATAEDPNVAIFGESLSYDQDLKKMPVHPDELVPNILTKLGPIDPGILEKLIDSTEPRNLFTLDQLLVIAKNGGALTLNAIRIHLGKSPINLRPSIEKGHIDTFIAHFLVNYKNDHIDELDYDAMALRIGKEIGHLGDNALDTEVALAKIALRFKTGEIPLSDFQEFMALLTPISKKRFPNLSSEARHSLRLSSRIAFYSLYGDAFILDARETAVHSFAKSDMRANGLKKALLIYGGDHEFLAFKQDRDFRFSRFKPLKPEARKTTPFTPEVLDYLRSVVKKDKIFKRAWAEAEAHRAKDLKIHRLRTKLAELELEQLKMPIRGLALGGVPRCE